MNHLTVPILIGLMTTGINASWYEGNQNPHHKVRKGSVTEAPRPKRKTPEEDKKSTADAIRQDLWIPCTGRSKPIIIPLRKVDNLRTLERRLSTTSNTNPLVIHLPPSEGAIDMSVVNLRGEMEAQNIDIGDRRGCLERLIALCAGSRKRIDPLAPPRLERQYSYYPGRTDSPTPFDRSHYVTKDQSELR